MAAALGGNDHMRVLDVSYNGLTRKACPEICLALRSNLRLEWPARPLRKQAHSASPQPTRSPRLEAQLLNACDSLLGTVSFERA